MGALSREPSPGFMNPCGVFLKSPVAMSNKAAFHLTRDSLMSGLEILGFAAAIMTTICWLPQAFRTIRTKDTKSLSLLTQSVFTCGVGLWLIYGILAGNAPVIFANGVTFILVAFILVLKLRYG